MKKAVKVSLNKRMGNTFRDTLFCFGVNTDSDYAKLRRNDGESDDFKPVG